MKNYSNTNLFCAKLEETWVRKFQTPCIFYQFAIKERANYVSVRRLDTGWSTTLVSFFSRAETCCYHRWHLHLRKGATTVSRYVARNMQRACCTSKYASKFTQFFAIVWWQSDDIKLDFSCVTDFTSQKVLLLLNFDTLISCWTLSHFNQFGC